MRPLTKRLRLAGITFPYGPLELPSEYENIWDWLRDRAGVTGVVFLGVRIDGREWDRVECFSADSYQRMEEMGLRPGRAWSRGEIVTLCRECLRRRVVGWGDDE